MSDREPRQAWSIAHREALTHFEKSIGVLAFVLGCAMVFYGSGLGSYAGVGAASIGAWRLFPSTRPLLSKLIDLIPGFPKSTPEA